MIYRNISNKSSCCGCCNSFMCLKNCVAWQFGHITTTRSRFDYRRQSRCRHRLRWLMICYLLIPASTWHVVSDIICYVAVGYHPFSVPLSAKAALSSSAIVTTMIESFHVGRNEVHTRCMTSAPRFSKIYKVNAGIDVMMNVIVCLFPDHRWRYHNYWASIRSQLTLSLSLVIFRSVNKSTSLSHSSFNGRVRKIFYVSFITCPWVINVGVDLKPASSINFFHRRQIYIEFAYFRRCFRLQYWCNSRIMKIMEMSSSVWLLWQRHAGDAPVCMMHAVLKLHRLWGSQAWSVRHFDAYRPQSGRKHLTSSSVSWTLAAPDWLIAYFAIRNCNFGTRNYYDGLHVSLNIFRLRKMHSFWYRYDCWCRVRPTRVGLRVWLSILLSVSSRPYHITIVMIVARVSVERSLRCIGTDIDVCFQY